MFQLNPKIRGLVASGGLEISEPAVGLHLEPNYPPVFPNISHGKSTILMVFTRKDEDFHGRDVSFREGIYLLFQSSFDGLNFKSCLLIFKTHKNRLFCVTSAGN